MSTSHTIDRRHRYPVIPASDLSLGEQFLNQNTGRIETFTGSLPDGIDPCDFVNVEKIR